MKTILVVDDDSAVLDVVGRALEGYRVWLARDPDEGMQMRRASRPWSFWSPIS
jgi:CheY-like chemotaxis protein